VARACDNWMKRCLRFLYGLVVGRSKGAAQRSRTEEVESKLIKWNQVQGTELQDRVCWPRLKHLDDRGLHKLLFFYHGDVSKLCDLVRQRIVFDSLTDLCRCLEEIQRNQRLKVVCLKNRFDTDADMSRTAGYRDVLVRVRVCTETTEELGVSGHVCELQLSHRKMSLHLSPSQHKRYLDYKNATVFRFYKTTTSRSRGSLRSIIGIYLFRILGMLSNNIDFRTDSGRGCVDQRRDCIARFDAITQHNTDCTADEKPLQDCLNRDGVYLGKLFATSDPDLESEMDAGVSRMLRMRWHNVGDFLTSKLQTEVRVAVHRTETAMLLFLAPSYGLHKWSVIISLFIISGAMITMFASGNWKVPRDEQFKFSARHVRLSVIETRQPNASSGMQFGNASTRSCTHQEGNYHWGGCSGDTSAGVKAFELEMDGCPLAMDEAKVSGNRSTRFFSFPRPRLANGWALTTLDGVDMAPADPVRFLIHVSPGLRKEKIAGKSPADCLVASGWSQNNVTQLGPLEVREQVVKIVKGAGQGWCDNDECVDMSDAGLLQMCLPPSHLDEDDWTLEGASSWEWPPVVLSAGIFGSIFEERSHLVLRSGAWVMLESKFLPLYSNYLHDSGSHLSDNANDSRGVRYSDNMWKEPQNLYSWMQFAFFILFVLGTLCALFRQTHAAHVMLALAILTYGGFKVAIAVLIDITRESNRIADDPYASAHWWFVGLAEIWAASVFYLFEHQFRYVPPILFIFVHLVVNLRLSMRFGASKPFLDALSSILFVIWLFYQLRRQRVLHQSRYLITDDMSVYNNLWRSLQTGEVSQDLLRLEESVIEVQDSSRSKHMRYQHQRYLTTEEMHRKIPFVSFSAAEHGLHGWSATFEERVAGLGFVSEVLLGQPEDRRTLLGKKDRIQSLDLLYAQAMMLNPIFQIKVQQIALASSGLFLVALSSERNESTVSFTPPRDWHRRGVLKRVDRVIEKVVRSYQGDVSRICDIVRQCIAFDTVHDICEAVRAMGTDPEIQVVRIKNRMSPSYDTRVSGGYRDVLLNVCIDSPLTRELGLFKHVCELQLILKPFVYIKTIEGHKRYVEFRNRRCE
jgi:hypothetical protein